MDARLVQLVGSSECQRWCWHDQSTKDKLLRQLFEAAVRELEDEDQRLFRAFGRAGKWKDEQCQGLAYWVYEHNLVFPIFRAWLPLVYRVIWDEDLHRLMKDGRRRDGTCEADRSGQTARTERRFIDLAVEPTEGAPRWLFEAKWWAYGDAKTVLGKDIGRLRSSQCNGGAGYLLTFWYGAADALAKDLRDADQAVAGLGVKMNFVGVFPTHVFTWWDRKKAAETGYFAMVAFAVSTPDSSA